MYVRFRHGGRNRREHAGHGRSSPRQRSYRLLTFQRRDEFVRLGRSAADDARETHKFRSSADSHVHNGTTRNYDNSHAVHHARCLRRTESVEGNDSRVHNRRTCIFYPLVSWSGDDGRGLGGNCRRGRCNGGTRPLREKISG